MKTKKLLSIMFLFSLIVSFAFVAPNINAMQIPEGAVIKTEYNPDVYIVKYKNGKQFKRLVLNPQVFESYGHLRWEDILIISQSEMDSFTESTLVRSDGESDVYKLVANGDLGDKALVESNYTYDSDSVYTINSVDSRNYFLKKLDELSVKIDELQKQIADIKTEISTPKVDFCNNIEGNQTYIPDGMYRENGNCYAEVATPAPTPTPTPTPTPETPEEVGELSASVDLNSPVSQQIVMGDTAMLLAKFKLTETSNKNDIIITQIIVTNTTSSVGSLSNIKLMDGTTTLGTVATLTADGLATFSTLNIVIPKNTNKIITVRADISPYPDGISASTHILNMSAIYKGNSNSDIESISVDSTGTAGTMTVYRTKLTISHAINPTVFQGVPSFNTKVAEFTISNYSNNYSAILKLLKIDFYSSWTNVMATREIKFYKDLSNGEILIASQDLSGVPYSSTNITESAFTDVIIAPGSSVNIIIRADTIDANQNGFLSSSLDLDGIIWSDGITNSITAFNGSSLGQTLQIP